MFNDQFDERYLILIVWVYSIYIYIDNCLKRATRGKLNKIFIYLFENMYKTFRWCIYRVDQKKG